MIYAITLAIISIVILGSAVIGLIVYRPHKTFDKLLLAICIYKFLNETTLLATGISGIRNHVFVNIYVLLFGVAMFILLRIMYKRIFQVDFSPRISLIVLFTFILTWLADNLYMHNPFTFNPLSQGLIYTVNMFFVLYLLSALTFSDKSKQNFAIDRILLLVFLLICFVSVIIDSFFNYYIDLPPRAYLVISDLDQVIGLIVNITLLIISILMIKQKGKLTPNSTVN